jgi:competence protein ComGC|tara:strand:+ start:552 stop:827 length:276 start_codon:yes stop_codon:yes gene_type:complete
MIEIFTTYNIVIGISAILNIVLLVGVRNLLKQNEQLEDTLVETNNSVKKAVQTSLDNMRKLDNNQAFEKDDEVGVSFNEIKKIIEELNNDI